MSPHLPLDTIKNLENTVFFIQRKIGKKYNKMYFKKNKTKNSDDLFIVIGSGRIRHPANFTICTNITFYNTLINMQ